jgi:hypothetical protein
MIPNEMFEFGFVQSFLFVRARLILAIELCPHLLAIQRSGGKRIQTSQSTRRLAKSSV